MVLPGFVFAQAALTKPKVSIDGDVEVGVSYFDQSHRYKNLPVVFNEEFSTILQAQLDFKVTVLSGLEAQFDIKGDASDRGVMLQKAFVELKPTSWMRLRVGNMKKQFGIEEQKGRTGLLTIERSLLHRYLDSFHIMGYDFAFEMRASHAADDGLKQSFWLQAGAQGDKHVFANLQGSVDGVWGALTAGGLGVHHDNRTDYTCFALSFVPSLKRAHAEVECVGGRDPHATDIYRRMGEPKLVDFAALRLLTAYPFSLSGELVSSVQPHIQGVYLAPDVDDPYQGRMQFLGGATLFLGPKRYARWMTDLELVVVRCENSPHFIRQQYTLSSQVMITW
jgi:hypothetical protein